MKMGLRLAGGDDKVPPDQPAAISTTSSTTNSGAKTSDSILVKVWDRMGGVRVQDRAHEAMEELRITQEEYTAAKGLLEVGGTVAFMVVVNWLYRIRADYGGCCVA